MGDGIRRAAAPAQRAAHPSAVGGDGRGGGGLLPDPGRVIWSVGGLARVLEPDRWCAAAFLAAVEGHASSGGWWWAERPGWVCASGTHPQSNEEPVFSWQVHVIEARELKAKDLEGTSDPVVFVEVRSRTHSRARARTRTLTLTHTHAHAHAHAHTHTRFFAPRSHAHTHTHIRTYTHARTHTRTRPLFRAAFTLTHTHIRTHAHALFIRAASRRDLPPGVRTQNHRATHAPPRDLLARLNSSRLVHSLFVLAPMVVDRWTLASTR